MTISLTYITFGLSLASLFMVILGIVFLPPTRSFSQNIILTILGLFIAVVIFRGIDGSVIQCEEKTRYIKKEKIYNMENSDVVYLFTGANNKKYVTKYNIPLEPNKEVCSFFKKKEIFISLKNFKLFISN